MNYKEFVSQLKEMLQECLGEDISIEFFQVTKNNDIKKDSFIFTGKDREICPAIYLEEYYCAYREGASFEWIVEEMQKVYQKCCGKMPEDARWFEDFDRMKERIFCKLVNRERNLEFLQNVPYIPYLDLAITFYYALQDESFGNGTVQILWSHLEMWGIREAQLYRIARKNTERTLPERLLEMKDLLGEMTFGMDVEIPCLPMYVLTNENRHFGASVILYDHILEAAAEKIGGNFYILPSSIHECIIVPEEEVPSVRELTAMVREINRTQVLPEEVLSDRIYHYDAKKHHLIV